MNFRKSLVMAALLGVSASCALAQDKPTVVTAASTKFANLPGLPACSTASVQNGDPTKGAAVLLAKTTSGCVVPWHWHTATERLMIVSGKGRVEARDAAASQLSAGDFALMPGKHQHQFTCTATCTFFIATDGAFDIHYVDKDGKEIPMEQALKPAAKPASTKGKK